VYKLDINYRIDVLNMAPIAHEKTRSACAKAGFGMIA